MHTSNKLRGELAELSSIYLSSDRHSCNSLQWNTTMGGQPAAVAEKIRVLCLHGFTQNADVFRKRTGSIRKPLKSKVDFVFVDGPHSAAGAFPDSERKAFDADEGEAEGGVGPRAWWLVGENAAASVAAARASLEKTSLDDEGQASTTTTETTTTTATSWVRPAMSRQMRGWEETAARIRDVVASQGPFDGVFAFSQGASTAALALALVPELAASVRFAVLVGGFEPMDPDMAEKLYHRHESEIGEEAGGEGSAPVSERVKKMNEVRSLHVHGVNDAMVSKQRVERLMNAFDDPELFEHGGGHGIPTGPDFRARLKEFILLAE